MKYDFTSILNRKGKDAVAVDFVKDGGAYPAPKEGFDVIPMDRRYELSRCAHHSAGYDQAGE